MNNNFQDYIKGLMDFGLTERESKVVMALLHKKTASMPELMDFSGVKHGKIYDVVGNLLRRGFCTERKIGRKRVFDMLNPTDTLRPLLQDMQSKLTRSERLIESLEEIFLNGEHPPKPSEYVEIIFGNLNIHKQVISMMRSAKNEICSFVKPPFSVLNEKMQREQMKANDELQKRGVHGRVIYEINSESPEWMREMSKIEIENNIDTRITDRLPVKMNIYDRETLLIADEEMSGNNHELAMTIVKQKTMVNGYLELFERVWKDASEQKEWLKIHAEDN